MASDDLVYRPISELSEDIRARRLSPLELAEATLRRIETLDRVLNAFITVCADHALEQAKLAEQEIQRGYYRGPLHGIPFSLKDIIATRGVRTTNGSRIWQDWVPDGDALCVARLKQAGAVLVGKNNLHEFAMGVTNINPHYGKCHNPWHLAHVPGGSSGGSGAAVAAGMSFMSIGTDTGGSIRLPASFCNLVGVKATYGLVSRRGVFPLSWSLDHAGPLTRTVRDAALSLQAIAGRPPAGRPAASGTAPDYLSTLADGVRGLRIGVPREGIFEYATETVEAVVRQAISLFADLGAQIHEVSLPHVHLASAVAFGIINPEAASIHGPWLHDRIHEYGDDCAAVILAGALLPGTEYVRAQRIRALIRREVAAVMSKVDVLATPTVGIVAPPIQDLQVTVRGRKLAAAGVSPRFTSLHNLTGAPAVTVPCGFDEEGLPIGMQLAGRPFDEATLFRAAYAYERATDWHNRHPSLV